MEPAAINNSNTLIFSNTQTQENFSLWDLSLHTDQLNQKGKLEESDGILLINIFNSSINYLKKKPINKELELKLSKLLSEVFKTENIHPKILKLAKRMDSLIIKVITPELENVKGRRLKPAEMPAVPKPQNVYDLVQKRKYDSRSAFQDYTYQLFVKNVTAGNYTDIVLNGNDGLNVNEFIARENLVVTLAHDLEDEDICSIKLWDRETGQYLWTHNPMTCIEKVHFAGDHVVCRGRFFLGNKICVTIRIIDLKTGKEATSITEPEQKIDSPHGIKFVGTNGKTIFCALNNGNIEEWDLEGKRVQLIKLEKQNNPPSNFLFSEKFLVQMYDSDRIIMIYDIEKKNKIKIDLKELGKPSQVAYIDGCNLFCCLDPGLYEGINPDFGVIDLETGHILNLYQAGVRSQPIVGAFPGIASNKINTAIIKKQWAYWGDEGGNIVGADLVKGAHVVFGHHRGAISSLALEGQILMSRSNSFIYQDAAGNDVQEPAEANFWDIKSMKHLVKMSLPSIENIAFVAGKVLISRESFLIQADFLVSHQGRIKIESLAPKVEESSEETNSLDSFDAWTSDGLDTDELNHISDFLDQHQG